MTQVFSNSHKFANITCQPVEIGNMEAYYTLPLGILNSPNEGLSGIRDRRVENPLNYKMCLQINAKRIYVIGVTRPHFLESRLFHGKWTWGPSGNPRLTVRSLNHIRAFR